MSGLFWLTAVLLVFYVLLLDKPAGWWKATPNETPALAVREWGRTIAPSAAFFAAIYAAFVSTDQLKLSRTSAERQDRAYVVVDGTISSILTSPFSVIVKITNTGKTPAKKLSSWMTVDIGSTLARKSGRFEGRSVSTLGAGQSSHLALPVTITDEQIMRLKKGETIFVYGSIEYTDMFDVQRHTHFSLFKNLTSPQVGDGLMIAPEGNDFD